MHKVKFELVTSKIYELSDSPTLEEIEAIASHLSKTSIFADELDEEQNRKVEWYYRMRIPSGLINHMNELQGYVSYRMFARKARPNELGQISIFHVYAEIKD